MTTPTQSFAERLRQKERLLGTMLTLPSAEIAELLANAGYDWLFIDAEHGAFDPHDAQRMLQAAGDCPAVIRVPSSDDIWLKKALDIGAAGVIVPQVNTAEQARQIVDACKYSPVGNRGIGISRAHLYGLAFEDYLNTANQQTAVILQAENEQAVANIESIVSVKGVDAILIGPYDLSANLGKIGQINDPIVQATIEKIRQACVDADMSLGIFGVSADAVKPYLDKGFNLITVGTDTIFMINAAKKTLQDIND